MAHVTTHAGGLETAALKQGSSSSLGAHDVAKGVRDMVPSPPRSVGNHLEEDKNFSSSWDEDLDHHDSAQSKATTPPRTRSYVTAAGGVVKKEEQPLNVMRMEEDDDDDDVELGRDFLGDADTVAEDNGLDNGVETSQNGGIDDDADLDGSYENVVLQGKLYSPVSSPPVEDAPAQRAAVKSLPQSWHDLSLVLPLGQTQEEKDKRREMFRQWDPNGNGFLSLAEIDKALKETQGLEELYKCKPAIMRAYTAAKTLKPADTSKQGLQDDDFVTKVEFRMLLVFLKLYYGLSLMFDSIDTNNDRRIDLDEFSAAAPILRDWGCPIYKDREAVFKIVDQDNGGQILFDEFCDWAIGNNVLVKEVFEARQAATIIQSLARGRKDRRRVAAYRARREGAAVVIQAQARGMKERRETTQRRAARAAQNRAATTIQRRARGIKDRERVAGMRAAGAAGPGREPEVEAEEVVRAAEAEEGANTELAAKVAEQMRADWRAVAHKLPWRKVHNDKMARAWLFKRWDSNGNGHLSLAEIDKGVRETPGLEGLYTCKPAIIRSYIAAKGLKPADASKPGALHDDDFVTRVEFRMLLVFLCVHYGLFQIFDQIDTGHDRRVNIAEFKAAAPQLRELGCPLSEDLDAEFAKVDRDGGGQILFNEFADWAVANNILINPALAEDVAGPAENLKPAEIAPEGVPVETVSAVDGAELAVRTQAQDKVLHELLESYQQLEEKLANQTENWNAEMMRMRQQIVVAIENHHQLILTAGAAPAHPQAQPQSALDQLDPVRSPRQKRAKKVRAPQPHRQPAAAHPQQEPAAPPPVHRAVSDGALLPPTQSEAGPDTSNLKPAPRKKRVPYLARSASDKPPVWRGWERKREEGLARVEGIQRAASSKEARPGGPRGRRTSTAPQRAVSKQHPNRPMIFGEDYRAGPPGLPKDDAAVPPLQPARRSTSVNARPAIKVTTTKAAQLRARAAAIRAGEIEELEKQDALARRDTRDPARDRLVMNQMALEANTERGVTMTKHVPVQQSGAIPYEWS